MLRGNVLYANHQLVWLSNISCDCDFVSCWLNLHKYSHKFLSSTAAVSSYLTFWSSADSSTWSIHVICMLTSTHLDDMRQMSAQRQFATAGRRTGQNLGFLESGQNMWSLKRPESCPPVEEKSWRGALFKYWRSCKEIEQHACQLSYIDILLSTINVWFLHRGRPPSSVTKSLTVFPFQTWPVTLHPCHSLRLCAAPAALFASNLSLLYSEAKNKVF